MAYIIAECGVNHNGNPQLASEMIAIAKKSGADCIKFQLFDAEKLEPPGERREMLRPLQLSREQIHELKIEAEKSGLDFLCTPFDIGSLEFLVRIGCTSVKIGSGSYKYERLLRTALRDFEKVIVSTGMFDSFLPAGDVRLHCTSAYPCPPQDVNLLAMTKLPKPYGLSDHTVSTAIPAAAVALGAEYIEKHFTLDRMMVGPDHNMSLNPEEFTEMVRNIRDIEVALGDGVKRPMPSEAAVMTIRDERERWRMSS